MTETSTILDPSTGKPARAAASKACPQCGKGPDRRVPSGGFGVAHPVCAECGYEWRDEVWRG